MKKLSLKNLSFLGLALMGVSALTAAIVPSKAKNEPAARDAGQLVLSSSGDGGNTVDAGPGLYSHTETGQTGNAIDNLSATSHDVALDTATNQVGVGLQTSGGTTEVID